MIAYVSPLLTDLPTPVLFGIIAVVLVVLSKGADLLVEEAVALSVRLGISSVVIGATIVSLGTTSPEAAVSVMGALRGNPGLALGNAVGSIIVDTGLILGLAAMIKPLPLQREIVNRQGWIQVGLGFLLVAVCFPWWQPEKALTYGGRLPQWVGWLFVVLLVVYLYTSVRWARSAGRPSELIVAPGEVTGLREAERAKTTAIVIKLLLGIGVVVGASQILIPAVEVTALRLGVPDVIIAATLVAFGTSIPELVTALTAVRRNHGELAVGNVIGADILNVLFVAGTSAAVTSGGLEASAYFFKFLFPAMLLLLVVFRMGVYFSGTHLRRPFGALLVLIYILVTIFSYQLNINLHG